MMSTVLLEKAKIKQSFAAASSTYDGVAELQRTVGKELLLNAGLENLSGSILDLGCGTGFLTSELLASRPGLESVIALDLAWAMLDTTRCKLSHAGNEKHQQKLIYLCADAEQLPIADRSLDGVFSNLALQWCNRLDEVLVGIRRSLKPGCPLVFSTFGPGTLRELKEAWAEIDGYSHVNEFYGERQLHHFLEQAGFSGIQIGSTPHRNHYVSVNALMQELKQIGAHNVSSGRNKNLTSKTRLLGMISAYEKHRIGSLIPATFEVINVVAEA